MVASVGGADRVVVLHKGSPLLGQEIDPWTELGGAGGAKIDVAAVCVGRSDGPAVEAWMISAAWDMSAWPSISWKTPL